MVDKKMNQSSDHENVNFEQVLKACRPSSQEQSVGEIMFAAGRAVERQEWLAQTVDPLPPADRNAPVFRWQIATAASLLISVACLGILVWQSNNSPMNSRDGIATSIFEEKTDTPQLADHGTLVNQTPAEQRGIESTSLRMASVIWTPRATELYSVLGRRSRMIKLAAQESFIEFDAPPATRNELATLSTAKELMERYSGNESL